MSTKIKKTSSTVSKASAQKSTPKTSKAAAAKKPAVPKKAATAKTATDKAKAPGAKTKTAAKAASKTATKAAASTSKKSAAKKTVAAKAKSAAATKSRKTKIEPAEPPAEIYIIGAPVLDPLGDTTDGEARFLIAEPELEAPSTEAAPAAASDEAEEMAEPLPPAHAERLQKILSQAGIASRRHAEEMIVAGRVIVNGQVVNTLGAKADPARDHIRVDGKLLQGAERHRYFVLNKPRGYVTTVSDPEGRPTVMEFFSKLGERLYPVGRLDYQSEGLLLMTNDGELANQLTRAASGVEKTYLVKIAGRPGEAVLNQLRGGVAIERGGPGSARVRTAPAQIRQIREGENPWFEVVLIEGRNRELRKMFSTVGHFVEKIRRVGYGPLVLDVEPGKFRELSQEEVTALQLTAEGKLKPRRPKTTYMLPKEAGRTVEPEERKPFKRGGRPGFAPAGQRPRTGRPFQPAQDRPQSGEQRPPRREFVARGERPERSEPRRSGPKPAFNRPQRPFRGERPGFNRPEGERNEPRGDRYSGSRPRFDKRPNREQGSGFEPHRQKNWGPRPGGSAPRREGSAPAFRGERPFGGPKPRFENRPNREQGSGFESRPQKSWGPRPGGPKPQREGSAPAFRGKGRPGGFARPGSPRGEGGFQGRPSGPRQGGPRGGGFKGNSGGSFRGKPGGGPRSGGSRPFGKRPGGPPRHGGPR